MPRINDMPIGYSRACYKYPVARKPMICKADAAGWPQVCILFLSNAAVGVRSEKMRDVCDANLGKRQTTLTIYQSFLVCLCHIHVTSANFFKSSTRCKLGTGNFRGHVTRAQESKLFGRNSGMHGSCSLQVHLSPNWIPR